MRPLFIPKEIRNLYKNSGNVIDQTLRVAERFKSLSSDIPDISIIIPAYNEEANILKTLNSLAFTNTNKAVEVIVVNNNSTDNTEFIAKATGVICIHEPRQGITFARNAGLSIAKGKYIINADADTIYPPNWIDSMIDPLIKNNNVSLTYGRFSFLPTSNTPRFLYYIYEHFSDLNKYMHRRFKEEAVNVYGFNSACKREDCLRVNGFDHPPGTNEDGWLAVKLRENGFGQLINIKHKKAIVWTTDRRIQIDGGLFIASIKRIWKNTKNIWSFNL